MKIREVVTKPQGPLTPEQARIEALKAQARRSQDAVKAERARQKMQSAQQSINKIRTHTQENYRTISLLQLEHAGQLKSFQAQLRVADGRQTSLATMAITVANLTQAMAIFRRLFGASAIISVKST